LFQNRGQILLSDGEYLLARGIQAAMMNATLELIYPKHSSFTTTLESEEALPNSIGQVELEGEAARLVFIFPTEKNIIHDICALIDGLGKRAGAMGAHFLMAGVQESSPLHYALCQCCYRPLYSQKFWKVDATRITISSMDCHWQSSSGQDLIDIQTFLKVSLPKIVQPVWQLKPQRYPDYVLYQNSSLCGMASVHRYGDSTFLYPLLLSEHPSPDQALAALVRKVHGTNIFLVIPSFQSFLESEQTRLKAVTVLKQTMMVRYFVIHQKATQEVDESILVKDKARKPSSPIAPTIQREKD
jgi:hypothetical protein